MSGNNNNSNNGSNIVWTSDLIAQTDFMVFRDISTDYITNVVAPNGLQVGLFDDNHIANDTHSVEHMVPSLYVASCF